MSCFRGIDLLKYFKRSLTLCLVVSVLWCIYLIYHPWYWCLCFCLCVVEQNLAQFKSQLTRVQILATRSAHSSELWSTLHVSRSVCLSVCLCDTVLCFVWLLADLCICVRVSLPVSLSWSFVWPTVFSGPWNFKLSNGICSFLRKYDIAAEFSGILQKLRNDWWLVQLSAW